MHDRYGSDVLGQKNAPRKPAAPQCPARIGLVIEDAASGWCGAILRVEKIGGAHVVELEDARGRTRAFPLGPGFLLEGRPVVLVQDRPAKPANSAPLRSASGSVHVAGVGARVARGSRIWVEGKHDAELVEKVWGHDLRIEGVVVEQLDGADNLRELVADFAPTPQRRLGVLLDHMVDGSKESRIAREVMTLPGARENVLVIGHPFIDIWQAVKPQRVGLRAWPHVPRGIDIKKGTLRALGWPCTEQADIAEGWQRILASVRHYGDLDPALIGRVEELIDWVTVPV
ncbi:DUF3097 domain-containing protein [Dermabacteraceae bacterium P13115]